MRTGADPRAELLARSREIGAAVGRRSAGASRPDLLARAREIGTSVGTAATRSATDPDGAWLARQVAGATAAVRADVLARHIAQRFPPPRIPAYRSAVDDAWVATQIAKRDAHVRRLAAAFGLSEDEAVRTASAHGIVALGGQGTGRI